MKFSITVTLRMAEFLEPSVFEAASELKVGRLEWTTQRDKRRVVVMAVYRDLSKYDGKLLLCRLKELSDMNGVDVSGIVVAVENNSVADAVRMIGSVPITNSTRREAADEIASTYRVLH
jgi:hypothetical protein